MSILLVIVILVALIVVHELGHFIVAKLMHVDVEEFGVGYPPRAYSIGTFGGTEYTLNWLPFGGFVKLAGEDPTKPVRGEARERSFSRASRPRQAAILVAGVAANALFAWMLFTGGFMAGMPVAVADDVPGARLIVSSVVPDSPADHAGLTMGDEIVRVADGRGQGPEPLTPSGVIAFVQARGGEPVTVTYARAGEQFEATLTPAHAVLSDESARPAIGIGLASVTERQLPFVTSVAEGFVQTGQALKNVCVALYTLAADALSGAPNLSAVVGPVGLVTVVDDSTQYGLGYMLWLAGFISVNLVIINLLPIPALDGGRLLFVALEGLTRRMTPKILFQALNIAGFAVIIFLMIAVTYNDIARLVG